MEPKPCYTLHIAQSGDIPAWMALVDLVKDSFPGLDPEHWVIRKPIGPCHYGIGTLFMQVEYPMRGCNLFMYVYVLSFYSRARKDERFLEALHALQSRVRDGQIVVERVVPKLSGLSFCKKGEKSEPATERYREILRNMAKE